MTTTSSPRSTRPTVLASGSSARTRSRLAAGAVVGPVLLTAGLVQAGTGTASTWSGTRSASWPSDRAVAHGTAHGPAAGLALVDELADAPGLQGTHLLPSVRGDLLERLGRADEAARESRRAAGLAATDRERDFLQRRADTAGRRPAR
jgi:hypothetical protein